MRPPRADRGDNEAFWPLEKLVREADVLTFHTPLNKTGAYQSLHMADDELLAALPDGRILINACRGAVVDNAALLRALEKGKNSAWYWTSGSQNRISLYRCWPVSILAHRILPDIR